MRAGMDIDIASAVEVINDLGFDTLTFLRVTVLVVPAFRIARASPVKYLSPLLRFLGFFCAGVVLNQFSLIRNLTDVNVLYESGILFLLFETGLELSLSRLKALARYAFGMGLPQSGLVALDLDLAQICKFVKDRLGIEVEMSGCKGPITTFIVEPFWPHDQEYYLSIVPEMLGCTISFSECGGIDIEENWYKVKTIFLPTEKQVTPDACAPLIANLPLEVPGSVIWRWIRLFVPEDAAAAAATAAAAL